MSKNDARRSRFDLFAKKMGIGMVELSISSGFTRSFLVNIERWKGNFQACPVGEELVLTGVDSLARILGG